MAKAKNDTRESIVLREPTEERIELYDLMRKKFPKGKEKSQLKLCMEIADDRVQFYMDMFSEIK